MKAAHGKAEYDVVVVGGGTSGTIIAARLAETPDLEVCLLEAGPSDEHQDVLLDVRNWIELLHSSWDFDYEIEAQPRGNSEIRHSRGRVLGGCSSHNSVIAFLPPEHDLLAWKARGVEGWGPDDLAPATERLLERVHLELPRDRNPLVAAWLQTTLEAGFPEADFSGGHFGVGGGWVALNAEEGIRKSSSVAYLHPLNRLPPNLEVVCDSPARRVLLDDDHRACAVELDGDMISARREVVIACGVFDTPKLLMLSGIGPTDKLQPHGIPTRVDLPGVGEHLLDHPEGVVTWLASREIPSEATQYLEATLIASRNQYEGHDLMCWCFAIPFDHATLRRQDSVNTRAFSMAFDVAYARSEGTIRLRSADPADAPIIDPRYFTDADGHDERVALEGVSLARELASHDPLASWIERELSPGEHVRATADLSAYVRKSAYTAFHPVGTCRMGPADDPEAVVDSRLRVRGIKNLRIADASIFPELIGVNPCLTCMVVGERAAELIHNDLLASPATKKEDLTSAGPS